MLKDIFFLIIQLTAINKFISQPSWSVEGEASLEYGQELETLQERLDVKFYGDLVLPEPPSTLRDAVLLSQEIPSLCEESKSPVTFSIVPISDYCGEAEKILNEITAANVDKERTQVIFFHCSCLKKINIYCNTVYMTGRNHCGQVSEIMDEFEEMNLNMELLLESKVALDYTRVGSLLNSLETRHIGFKHNITKNIQEVLPEIRGGGAAERQLTDLVNKYDISPFAERTFKNMLKTRKREIEVIDSIIEVSSVLENVKVDIDGSGDGFECGLRKQFMLHYVLHLLPYENPNEFAQMYTDGVLPNEDDKWFNDLTISGKMGKMSIDFQKFAELNADQSICFVISLERGAQDWHNQESNFELVMYEHGKVLKKYFNPPTKIRTDYIEKLEVDWDNFKIKVPHEKVEYQSKIFMHIQDVICQKSLNTTKQAPMVQGTSRTEITVAGLHPSCVYEATFTIWMFSGTMGVSLQKAAGLSLILLLLKSKLVTVTKVCLKSPGKDV